MKRLVLLLSSMFLMSCTHGNCHVMKRAEAKDAKEGTMMPESKITDRVKVSKMDGSLQCNQGKKIALVDMQKELGKIEVFSAQNLNDGMMRIQKCGSPTGNHNVFEIDRKDLEIALSAGFKEWLVE